MELNTVLIEAYPKALFVKNSLFANIKFLLKVRLWKICIFSDKKAE